MTTNLTASPATKRTHSERRRTSKAKRSIVELNPTTGKPMSIEETETIHEMLDTICRRAAQDYAPFRAASSFTKATLQDLRRRSTKMEPDAVARAIDAAFVTGAEFAGRAVAWRWAKVSSMSALAYALTGQDDPLEPPASITIKGVARR